MSHAGIRGGGRVRRGEGGREGDREIGGRWEVGGGWEKRWEEGRWGGDGEETYSYEFRMNHAALSINRL